MKPFLARITANSGIYLSTSLLTRGIGILMIPVYTRMLTPADYGVMAVASTVGSLLTTLLGCALESCVMQFYFIYKDPEDLRQIFTDILIFWLVVSGCFLLALDSLGRTGIFDHLFTGIPFHPYLRLVFVTSYLTIFANLPLAIYLARQQSLRVMSFSLGSAAITAVLTLFAIVHLKSGALGVLEANLVSAGIVAVVSLGLMANNLTFRRIGSKLGHVLQFSLPLVPHNLSNWVLNLSDRFILGRYVSLHQVGIYALGYQCGSLTSLAGTSINNAVAPEMTRSLTEDRNSPLVPALGNYAILILTWAGLFVSVLGGELLRIVAGKSFAGTEAVVSWVVLGYIFQGAYYVSSRGTWMSLKTKMVPVLTALAGAISIALNVFVVPRWGIRAAAIDTAATFALLAIMHSILAHKLYPIPWQFGKWARIFAAALACYACTLSLASGSAFARGFAKCVIVAAGFPVLLIVLRVLDDGERDAVIQTIMSAFGRVRQFFLPRPRPIPVGKTVD